MRSIVAEGKSGNEKPQASASKGNTDRTCDSANLVVCFPCPAGAKFQSFFSVAESGGTRISFTVGSRSIAANAGSVLTLAIEA